jgi:hypothetical protein
MRRSTNTGLGKSARKFFSMAAGLRLAYAVHMDPSPPTATPSLPSFATSVEVPTVLDMEASGFGPHSYPIEVGYVLPDGSTYCTLIQPAPDWTHWDAKAEQTHHIARATAMERGRPAVEVARWLNDQLHGQTVYSDGWAHDYTWLGMLFDAADMSPSFKLDNLRVLLSEREANHWHVVKEQVRRELRIQRHRASSDARLLQLTLARLRAPLPQGSPG